MRAELGRHQRALQAALILQRLQDAADRLVSWILPVCQHLVMTRVGTLMGFVWGIGSTFAACSSSKTHLHYKCCREATAAQAVSQPIQPSGLCLQREGPESGCGPGAMRFGAHFALALRATGLVAEPSWEEDQYDPLQVRII